MGVNNIKYKSRNLSLVCVKTNKIHPAYPLDGGRKREGEMLSEERSEGDMHRAGYHSKKEEKEKRKGWGVIRRKTREMAKIWLKWFSA